MASVEEVKANVASAVDGAGRAVTGIRQVSDQMDEALTMLRLTAIGSLHPQIAVAIGAGHAFKFAALIGTVLADLALGREPSHPIDAFAIDRPALTDPGFARSFHV